METLGSDLEGELIEALRVLETRPDLPVMAELEPGALLHLVKDAWTQAAGRDGRRGHLSETQIARFIQDRTGRAFSRNQYQAMFGERRIGGERYYQPIPRDVADAFLWIALNRWRRTSPQDGGGEYTPIVDPREHDIGRIIANACKAMYGDGHEARPVYCRPTQGRGVLGFYQDAGRFRRSLLLATPRDPIIIRDPGQHVLLWQRVMENLLLCEEVAEDVRDRPKPIHVWAFEEPAMRRDELSASAAYSLGRVQSVLNHTFGVAKAEDKSGRSNGQTAQLWQAIQSRCVIAMRRRYTTLDKEPDTVVPDLIFPTSVPARWASAGATDRIDKLMTIAAFEHEDRLDFHVADLSSSAPPITLVPSPGQPAELSFKNLFAACRAFLTSTSDGALGRAEADGWVFLTPEEFRHMDFPLEAGGSSHSRSN